MSRTDSPRVDALARFNSPTVRVTHSLRRIVFVQGLLLGPFVVVVGIFSQTSVLIKVALIVVGILYSPLFFWVANHEQRRIDRCRREGTERGATSVQVFFQGWRVVEGARIHLKSGWIGVKDGSLVGGALRVQDAAEVAALLRNGRPEFRRRTELHGMAYSQLEIATADVELRLELADRGRLLPVFLSDARIDEVVSEFSDAVG